MNKPKTIIVLIELAILAYMSEGAGVREGCFRYNYVYIPIGDIPLMVMIAWVFLGCLAYIISKKVKKYGTIIAVIAVSSIDLVLEPFAYYTGLWTWLKPASPQIYFGSTIANAILWRLYPFVAIQLLRWTEH